MDILIENAQLLSPDQEHMLEGQNVVVSNGRIVRVTSDPVEPEPETRRIPGRGRLMIPGLINAHSHSPENLLKGRYEGLPLEFWLSDIFGSSFAFTEREIYLSAMIGAIEMLKTGTTAVVDHFWVNGKLGRTALDSVMNAYREVGIRAAVAPLVEDQHRLNALILAENPDLSREVYGVSPPSSADEYLDLLDDFFQAWHLKHDGRLRCLAGPSGVQWCSDRLLVGSIELAERYDTGLHMHVEETKLHAVACRELLGRSAVAHLAELGVLKERASLAHCVWVDDDDIETIVEADATVVHNPVCNLKLGSGFAPILEILGRGGHVALACDGAASNDSQIMFEAMKTAGLMHTVRSSDHRRWVSARRIFQMATVEAAKVMRLQGELGSIHPGALADLVLLDIHTPAFTPLNDPYQQLVFSETGSSVRTVIVNGRVVLDDGRLLTVDEGDLLAEANELWQARRRQIPPLSPEAMKFEEALQRFRESVLSRPFVVDRF